MEDVGLIADRTVQAEYRRFVRDRLFELGRPARRDLRTAALTYDRPSFATARSLRRAPAGEYSGRSCSGCF